jgi:signal transduction histidine kinase
MIRSPRAEQRLMLADAHGCVSHDRTGMLLRGEGSSSGTALVRKALKTLNVLVAAGAWCVVAATAAADVRVTQVVVDGREMPVDAAAVAADAAPLRVPSSVDLITFVFEGEAAEGNAGGDIVPAGSAGGRLFGTLPALRGSRLRYRLDGVDGDWRDAPAHGRLSLIFLDAAGSTVGSSDAKMHGTSEGWRGLPETSLLKVFSLSGIAPPLASSVMVNFLSNGGDEVVGAMAIDDVVLSITGEGREPRRHALSLGGLGDDVHPLATPKGWGRSGSRGEMSRVAVRPESGKPILVIEDDDPTEYGSWVSRGTAVPVEPGDVVTVSWQAAYSLGLGGRSTASYNGLEPGTYWFRVAAFLPGGQPTAAEAGVRVVVVPPWYWRRDVWAGCAAVGLVAGALVARTVSLRRMRRRLDELERVHTLDRERARIARDLHDDIGAGLTEIAMQTDWVRRDVQGLASAATVARAEKACASASDLVRSVDAIVWAVNPANDTLDRFVPYLTHSAEQFLDAAGVSVRFDVPDTVPPLPLAGAVRHDLFLVVREAINNAVKHARAQVVRLGVRLENGAVHGSHANSPQLLITVDDDGRGFSLPSSATAAQNTGRSGLANMRRRVEDLGGRFVIESRPGAGTRIEVTVPLAMDPATASGLRKGGAR